MSRENGQFALRGLVPTVLGTLASRGLGLARDIATAALLGLGQAGIMDALVIAFRIPNLFRRLLGEGALATSYLPVLTGELERDRTAAWQLTSALLVTLTLVLTLLVIVGEILCAAVAICWGPASGAAQLAGLTAAMLPYLVFVCIAAQLSATLQALGNFNVPAIMPIVLNVCWLAGVLLVAPHFESAAGRAYVVAGCVLVAGVLQVLVQLRALVKLGFRFRFQWAAVATPLKRIGTATGIVSVGLAVTQINTLLDSVLAWTLSAPPGSSRHIIAWLPGQLSYPMQSGAAAAIYYGERFYQLPVGLIGMGVATVAYPLLSRHAAGRDRRALSADLTASLRLVLFATIPASVGLVLLAHPLVQVLFERGAFTAEDTARAARMIACYASAAWAYCAMPVLVRAFYALGDQGRPVRAALYAMVLDLVLNLTLVWPLAEAGLAVSTALVAIAQLGWLAVVFSRAHVSLAWREMGTTVLKSAAAAAMMGLVLWAATAVMPSDNRPVEAVWLAGLCGAGALIYIATAWSLGSAEVAWLAGRKRESAFVPPGDLSAKLAS